MWCKCSVVKGSISLETKWENLLAKVCCYDQKCHENGMFSFSFYFLLATFLFYGGMAVDATVALVEAVPIIG